MPNRRVERINGLLRQEISELISREIKDPRLGVVVSITQVQTANDLRNARVYLSVMGNDETKQGALEGIRSAATFMRRELRDRLAMRYVPFLKFELDNSIENADRLLQLIDQAQVGESGSTDGASETGKTAPSRAKSSYRGPLSFTPPGR